MIQIDLVKLARLEVNINQYLTLYKIYRLNNNDDIPFSSTSFDIDSLTKKGYLDEKGNGVFLTDKAKRHFKFTSVEDDITEIINHFKETTNKNKISTESATNRRYVRDRLAQGYTKEDLKKVTEFKYKEWKDNSMSKYIRIETLFNQEKFQKYINDVESISVIPKEGANRNVKRI